MFGQKCANCGYEMGFVESAVVNLLLLKKKSMSQGMLGMNILSNANNLKCPNCGEVGRWFRDDE